MFPSYFEGLENAEVYTQINNKEDELERQIQAWRNANIMIVDPLDMGVNKGQDCEVSLNYVCIKDPRHFDNRLLIQMKEGLNNGMTTDYTKELEDRTSSYPKRRVKVHILSYWTRLAGRDWLHALNEMSRVIEDAARNRMIVLRRRLGNDGQIIDINENENNT